MSITTAQIRGARGILNWSQQDLAKRTGISATSIGSIENGITSPRENTLIAIKKAFEDNGIEFTDREGVRRTDENIATYVGTPGIRRFFDDVYETTRKLDSDICLFNGVPHNLIKWLGEDWYKKHAERMRELSGNFVFKIIVEEGENLFIANGFAEYRWFPKSSFNERTIYCYGDKVGFLHFSKDNVVIHVMRQAEVADSIRVLFDIAWDNVAITPQNNNQNVA